MSACDEEPCKSLLDEHLLKEVEASAAAASVRIHCGRWKDARQAYWTLFSVWAAVFAHAVMCATLHLPEALCAALIVASFVLLVALMAGAARIIVLRRNARSYEEACSLRLSRMLAIRREIAVKCPPECRPGGDPINCHC